MKPNIIVDADACPVKREIAEVAALFGVNVVLVASYDHLLEPSAGVSVVQVDRSDQSVDLYIANRLTPGDIVVTQDFGLATIALAKRAFAISNRGQLYTDNSIDFLLEKRHEHAKRRRSGKHTKGPRAFSDSDRQAFRHSLTKLLSEWQENVSSHRIVIRVNGNEGGQDE